MQYSKLWLNGECWSGVNTEKSKSNLKRGGNEKTERTYKAGGKAYNKVSSALFGMFLEKKKDEYINFTVLTFKDDEVFKDEVFTNQIFNKFIKRFYEKFSESYVGVMERTKKGVIHYHFIFKGSFVDYQSINNLWVSTINTFVSGYVSSCGFRTKKGSNRLSDVKGIKYICKYLRKDKEIYKTKRYFICQSLRKYTESIEIIQMKTDGTFDNTFEKTFEKKYDFNVLQCYNPLEIFELWKDIK